jgi:hypothetical protein
MLLHFRNYVDRLLYLEPFGCDPQSLVYRRQIIFKLDVDDRPDDLNDPADLSACIVSHLNELLLYFVSTTFGCGWVRINKGVRISRELYARKTAQKRRQTPDPPPVFGALDGFIR